MFDDSRLSLCVGEHVECGEHPADFAVAMDTGGFVIVTGHILEVWADQVPDSRPIYTSDGRPAGVAVLATAMHPPTPADIEDVIAVEHAAGVRHTNNNVSGTVYTASDSAFDEQRALLAGRAHTCRTCASIVGA